MDIVHETLKHMTDAEIHAFVQHDRAKDYDRRELMRCAFKVYKKRVEKHPDLEQAFIAEREKQIAEGRGKIPVIDELLNMLDTISNALDTAEHDIGGKR